MEAGNGSGRCQKVASCEVDEIRAFFRSVWNLPARGEVVCAFGELEDVDEGAVAVPETADGSLADFSEHGLEARDRLCNSA